MFSRPSTSRTGWPTFSRKRSCEMTKHVQLQQLSTSELLLLFERLRGQLARRTDHELEVVKLKLAKLRQSRSVRRESARFPKTNKWRQRDLTTSSDKELFEISDPQASKEDNNETSAYPWRAQKRLSSRFG